MHRQASFIPAFFPEGTVVGEDADFFYFPAYAGKDLGAPVLGAGTLWAITNENEAAHDLIAYLQDPVAHEIWMARKGFLTPHKGVNPNAFGDPTLRKMNDILLGRHDLPLRRIRPDAGRSGPGQLLDWYG